jgi:hypothetical protein
MLSGRLKSKSEALVARYDTGHPKMNIAVDALLLFILETTAKQTVNPFVGFLIAP